MRYKLLIVLLLIAFKGISCKCAWTSIEENYAKSSLIFYGKHIGSIQNSFIHNLNGKPVIFDQFEVLRFYKGMSNSVLKQQLDASASAPYIISIRQNCQETSCGFCFDSAHYYLVYANPVPGSMFMEPAICSRSKEIEQHQFMVPSAPDPDAGKDESRELIRLAQNDTLAKDFPNSYQAWVESLKLQEETKIGLQKQLKKKGSMTIILSTTTLILLIYVLLDWFKKRKA
ncbi:MAG: hypothetical protein K9H61_07255 [Bacteroidia bacterium]|nr:hypothetical protein [Bacteroidia bacterium]MCF8446777.1 hypothetical protein [Bacteroidia bacterium]